MSSAQSLAPASALTEFKAITVGDTTKESFERLDMYSEPGSGVLPPSVLEELKQLMGVSPDGKTGDGERRKALMSIYGLGDFLSERRDMPTNMNFTAFDAGGFASRIFRLSISANHENKAGTGLGEINSLIDTNNDTQDVTLRVMNEFATNNLLSIDNTAFVKQMSTAFPAMGRPQINSIAGSFTNCSDRSQRYTGLYCRLLAVGWTLPMGFQVAANVQLPQLWPVLPADQNALANLLRASLGGIEPITLLDANGANRELNDGMAGALFCASLDQVNGVPLGGGRAGGLAGYFTGPMHIKIYGNDTYRPAALVNPTIADVQDVIEWVRDATGDSDGLLEAYAICASFIKFVPPEITSLASPWDHKFVPLLTNNKYRLMLIWCWAQMSKLGVAPGITPGLLALLSGNPAAGGALIAAGPGFPAIGAYAPRPAGLPPGITIFWRAAQRCSDPDLFLRQFTMPELKAANDALIGVNVVGLLTGNAFADPALAAITSNTLRRGTSMTAVGVHGTFTVSVCSGLQRLFDKISKTSLDIVGGSSNTSFLAYRRTQASFMAHLCLVATLYRACADRVVSAMRLSQGMVGAARGTLRSSDEKLNALYHSTRAKLGGLPQAYVDYNAFLTLVFDEINFTLGIGFDYYSSSLSASSGCFPYVSSGRDLHTVFMCFPPHMTDVLLGEFSPVGGIISPSGKLDRMSTTRITNWWDVKTCAGDLSDYDFCGHSIFALAHNGFIGIPGVKVNIEDSYTGDDYQHTWAFPLHAGGIPSMLLPNEASKIVPSVWWIGQPTASTLNVVSVSSFHTLGTMVFGTRFGLQLVNDIQAGPVDFQLLPLGRITDPSMINRTWEKFTSKVTQCFDIASPTTLNSDAIAIVKRTYRTPTQDVWLTVYMVPTGKGVKWQFSKAERGYEATFGFAWKKRMRLPPGASKRLKMFGDIKPLNPQ